MGKVNKIKIPRPYNKFFKVATEFEGENSEDWEFKKGDQIDGYGCHFIAYLESIDKNTECLSILTDDKEFPVVELVGGRLYPVQVNRK